MKKFEITIKAKQEYRVKYTRDRLHAVIVDGDDVVFVATPRTMEDFIDEVLNGKNECARLYEVFQTAKGNTMLYWRDDESDEDYITKQIVNED